MATIDGGRYPANSNSIVTILIVLLLIAALPTWPYSAGWGFYPSGGFGLLLLVVLVLAFSNRA